MAGDGSPRDRRSPSQSSTEPVPEAVLLRPRPSWSEYDTVRSFRIAVADVAHCSMNIDEHLIELAQRKHHLIDRTDIASVMTSGQWCRLLDHGLWLSVAPGIWRHRATVVDWRLQARAGFLALGGESALHGRTAADGFPAPNVSAACCWTAVATRISSVDFWSSCERPACPSQHAKWCIASMASESRGSTSSFRTRRSSWRCPAGWVTSTTP